MLLQLRDLNMLRHEMHMRMEDVTGLMKYYLKAFSPHLLCLGLCTSVLQDHQLRPDPTSDHYVGAGGVSCSSGR